MKDLNILDDEMNSDTTVDECEVLVTLDSGGISGSSTPPLNTNKESTGNIIEPKVFNNNCLASREEVTCNPKKVQTHMTEMIPEKGEKEKTHPIAMEKKSSESFSYKECILEKSCKKEYNSSKIENIGQHKITNSGDININRAQIQPNIPTINDFKILKVLGKGAYGKVYQVRKISGPGMGQIYAMKAMNKSRICGSKTDVRHTKAERDVLVSVNKESNPFIVRLHFAFETERRLYLVQEFCCGGELFRRMEFERLMLEKDAIFYLSEIVIALEYLHSKGIVYRDLKTENVMLDKQGHVKLIDFGLSKMNMEQDTLTNTFCGTVEYMAPEVILRSSGYGKPADWWSLGIFTFDLLTGRSPFHSNQGKAATKERILRGKFPTPKILTPEAGDFIRKLLRKAVPKRLGTQGAWEVKSHGLFQDLDWDKVIRKQYKPPFEPFVKDDTDVQHFDEQFTSRSPRESNEQPPNQKGDEQDVSTKTKAVPDYSNMFEDFDYASEIFVNENRKEAENGVHIPSTNPEKHYEKSCLNNDDIITDPVEDSDEGIFDKKNCSKCQLQFDVKHDSSNSNSGDENKTVDELKDLRICSHGS